MKSINSKEHKWALLVYPLFWYMFVFQGMYSYKGMHQLCVWVCILARACAKCVCVWWSLFLLFYYPPFSVFTCVFFLTSFPFYTRELCPNELMQSSLVVIYEFMWVRVHSNINQYIFLNYVDLQIDRANVLAYLTSGSSGWPFPLFAID